MDHEKTLAAAGAKTPWKQSARRVQLAVKRTARAATGGSLLPGVLQSPSRQQRHHINDSDVDGYLCSSVDQALSCLYYDNTDSNENAGTFTSPRSYVPQPVGYDWVIDGLAISEQDRKESNNLMEAFRRSSDWKYLEERIREAQVWSASSSFSDGDDAEDDEFGDFQSAPAGLKSMNTYTCEPTTPNIAEGGSSGETKHACDEKSNGQKETGNDEELVGDAEMTFKNTSTNLNDTGGQTHLPQTPCGTDDTVDTVKLVARADQLLEDRDHISSPFSVDTPKLVRQTDQVLQLFHESQSSPITEFSLRQHESTTPLRPYKIEKRPRFSLSLPLTDLGTPEAQYIRRKQKTNIRDDGTTEDSSRVELFSTDIESLGLPEHYFSDASSNDDTGQVLASLPWYYMNESSNLDLWDEHMATELSRLDSARQCVNHCLLARIQPREADLERASALLHSSDRHLRLADLYHERTNEAVAVGARGIAGMRALLQVWSRKEACLQLARTFRDINDIQTTEATIIQSIDNLNPLVEGGTFLQDYRNIMDISDQLLQRVTGEPLNRLQCLDATRQRLQKIDDLVWGRICTLLDNSLLRYCRRSGRESSSSSSESLDFTEYQDLLNAAADLSNKTLCDEKFQTRWTGHLLRTLLYEGDRALAIALIDPCQEYNRQENDSEFDEELAKLAVQIETGWGDVAKLRTVTHNLVTIRFDFEFNNWYLVGVFQKLCRLLVDILDVHCQLQSWHLKQEDIENQNLAVELRWSRNKLWAHCEDVLERCLHEYFNFSVKRKLFSTTKRGVVDEVWMKDLDQLHVVHALTERFLSLYPVYTEHETAAASTVAASLERGAGQQLVQKLCDIFRKHLRGVHVEAMNSMGRLLSGENWVLVSVEPYSEANQHDDELSSVPMCSMATALLRTNTAKVYSSSKCCLHPLSTESDTISVAACDDKLFALQFSEERKWLPSANPTLAGCYSDSSVEARRQIQDRLNSMCSSESRCRVASNSAYTGLIPWIGRLLVVVDFLPLIVEDASAVLANLIDLYFVTVLRICASCGADERRLLGIDPPDEFPVAIASERRPVPTKVHHGASQLFGSFRLHDRRSSVESAAIPTITLPRTLTADICSPRLQDYRSVDRLSSFITRAQDSLQDIVNIDLVDGWLSDSTSTKESLEEAVCGHAQILEKRMAAAWSCYFVAALGDAAAFVVRANCCRSRATEACTQEAIDTLYSYVGAVLEATPTLVERASRMSCARAVNCGQIVHNILSERTGWEETKLHEEPNDYVYTLSHKCGLLWGYTAASAKLPEAVLHCVWNDINTMSYLALLEGFARVSGCSTEGRALMTLDLATFHEMMDPSEVLERLNELSMPFQPPKGQMVEGMRYVETYIKVFYYPKDDVITWIERNSSLYTLNHLLALATAAVCHPEQSPELSRLDLVTQVQEVVRAEMDKIATS